MAYNQIIHCKKEGSNFETAGDAIKEHVSDVGFASSVDEYVNWVKTQISYTESYTLIDDGQGYIITREYASQDDMIIDLKTDKSRNLRIGMNGNGWRVECIQPTWAEIIN